MTAVRVEAGREVDWSILGVRTPSERLFQAENGNGAVLKQIFQASRLKPYYPPRSCEPCGTGTSDECKDIIFSDFNMIVLHTHGVRSVY